MQDSLRQAVEAAVRNRDRESEQALSTLSSERDRALHRALEVKELEMRKVLDDEKAGAVAKAVAEANERERRAVNNAVAAEVERGRKAREETARALEERVRDVENEVEERARVERDKAVARAVEEEGKRRAIELEGVVAKGEEEMRRAVKAAEARKDREMSKALKVLCWSAFSVVLKAELLNVWGIVDSFDVLFYFRMKSIFDCRPL